MMHKVKEATSELKAEDIDNITGGIRVTEAVSFASMIASATAGITASAASACGL